MLTTMNASVRGNLIVLALLIVPRSVLAAPQVVQEPQRLVVTAHAYRITFDRYRSEFRLELRDGRGQWQAVTKPRTQPEFAVVDAQGVYETRWTHAHSFLQAYSRDQLYFYPAIAGRGSRRLRIVQVHHSRRNLRAQGTD